jgi:hypothetical protein
MEKIINERMHPNLMSLGAKFWSSKTSFKFGHTSRQERGGFG